MAAPLWALVLADNHGRRPSGMIGGVARPMWSLEGGPSVLEQALARVAGLVPGGRTVTVVGPTQRASAAALRDHGDPGYVLRQPGDRGTAPGVLLGLAAVLEVRPDAQVLLTPANYTLRDSDQFRLSVREAASVVRSGQSDVVVFGARPTGADEVSSWITPGATARAAGPRLLRDVDCLVDRPGPDDIAELLRRQALWNTGVVVARAQALFDLYATHLPYMVEMLGRVLQVRPALRGARLEEEYRVLRPADFSRDVLGRAGGLTVYTWPAAIGYSRVTNLERSAVSPRQRSESGGRANVAAPGRERRASTTGPGRVWGTIAR